MDHAVTGYLPAWAEGDPTATDVPLGRLAVVMADMSHQAPFDGQFVAVRCPSMETGTETSDVGDGQSSTEYILWGNIECSPYAQDPNLRVPVVNIAVIADFWINGLDPAGLADVAGKLRAQADRLDHEVRPALMAARADWAAHHRS